ncbi:MAG: LPS assembly lipoprotein LptE [Desulfovibrionaceae bacterium]|jgi:LPS-assembly lipoprotein|nr:LPS assembly lipoprotein LptE [Desulfovibrionaceae bacterium]
MKQLHGLNGSARARRRLLAAAGAALLLSACGFTLRQAPDFGFKRIALAMPSTALATELRRQLEGTGRVEIAADAAHADAVLESAGETRERTVVSVTATGEVREFQLRIRFKFRLRAADGRELLPEAEILRQIDQSYSESAALSKEAEALMLYQNMQSDIVQQVIRRLAK